VSGGAYFLHDGYQEKLSLDVAVQAGTVQPGGWLKYYSTKTRMNLVSTEILSLSVVGTIATVTGTGTLNGAAGYRYRFVATITDGAPDAFGITIRRPDGTLYYQYAQPSAGGGFTIQP
jgi:hypothetical protein